jgi:tRNA threonylcarbamoyladenosine biosynthesis protein TsaE
MHQSSIPIDITLPDEQATQKLGARLWPLLRAGDCILLSGALGMGKTCFARGLIQAALGTDQSTGQDIPSPSFALLQYYDSTPPIWHFDFYRLKNPQEIWELGFEDALDNICLIEWPEKAAALMPKQALEIKFARSKQKQTQKTTALEAEPRLAQIFAPANTSEESPNWRTRLADFK